MNKKLATALTVFGMLSSLIFSTAPAFATPDEDKKITICHATHSETNPFVEITISKNALKAHFSDGHQEGEDTFGPCPKATPAPEPSATVPPVKETPAPTPPAKGTTPATTVPVPPHAEPNPGTPHTVPNDLTAQPYPAPSVTPNTVNGVVPESANPTPAPTVPVTPAATATDRLADTGANDGLYIWGAVGLLALIAGVWSVIHARRKA